MEETLRQVIDDVTSRGALSGAASVLLLFGLVGGWWVWTSRATRERESVRASILITGSRGKSSTVRLIHAALPQAGFHPYGKITGTEASELSTNGTERPTFRLGAPSVTENFGTMRRAFRGDPRADCLVFECMAISPPLIALLSDRIVDPDTVVITNVRLDHLEEEGSDRVEIARSLSSAIRPESLVVTGETEAAPLAAIEERAGEIGASVIGCDAGEVPQATLSRLPSAHPQNVALALAVTRSLGVEDEVAIEGMARASREPGDHEIWQRRLDGLEATWFDLGAVNDPESLAEALDQFDAMPIPAGPRIALVFGRWDRPLRALEFAGFLRPDAFDGLVLAGGPVHPMRTTLLDGGWHPDRVIIASPFDSLRPVWTREVSELTRKVDAEATAVVVTSLENEHDGLADRVRAFFTAGDRVDGLPAGDGSGHVD